MTLSEYLKTSGRTLTEFAKACKMDRVTVWRAMKGRHSPRADHVDAIERASGYQVRAADLVKHPKNGRPHKLANM